MSGKLHLGRTTALLALFLLWGMCPVFGAGFKQLHGHVPEVTRHLTAIGRLPATNELHLAIGVPLRDSAGLDKFLADVYDPASPNYRHFLTPEEFTARFSATEADYAAVKNFARANGFKITQEHGNRLLLSVTAQAADVERAFHFKLKKFQHPTESRKFFAPDAEPTVDVALTVADISGLSDYYRPHPKLRKIDPNTVAPKNGSAPDSSGAYFGNDFRNAYAPGVTLTGAGQQVGLFQLDGYYANDIAAYAQQAGGGRTNIQVVTVPVGSTSWSIGVNGGNGEVSLDIEMAMAMAPGLSKILVFEGPLSSFPNDILNAMAASNTVKNLSCSWGWGGGPQATTDAIFQTMAAQGQSFFNASGDSCAFTVGAGSVNGVDNTSTANAPSSSPYITQVGGTTLTTGSSATYSSETVWNWGGGQGSSGGVSSYYSIPSWQTNISMTANLGSTTQRNIPDVALTADNIYVISGGSAVGSGGTGGTSVAAPLWAGFMALVNQQAASLGNPPAGFINPAVYSIGKGSNSNYSYTACFHDTTSGNNFWTSSKSKYPATTGYDLCTGWGTPAGTNLIYALAGKPDPLAISPTSGFSANGAAGGPFTGAPQTFTLTNTSGSSLTWSLVNTSTWLTVSNSGGSLTAGKQTNVIVNLTAAANSLGLGSYTATIIFSNQTTHVAQPRQFTLQTLPALLVSPTSGFTASGPVGGVFNVSGQSYALTNLSATGLNWGIVNTSLWLTASPPSGSLPGNANTNLTISLNPSANLLPVGIYNASVIVTNQGIISATLPFTLQIGQSLIQNGGFETGGYSPWTLTDNGGPDSVNSGSLVTPHSGTYAFAFGQASSLAYLSQTLTTVPGQSYLLSFWYENVASGTTEQFIVNWITNATGTNVLMNQLNPAASSWTAKNFIVIAASTNTTLQFAARNDPSYFGLDDVSVTPIPAPTFTSFSKKTNAFTLTWNSLAGITNVIQYKTNLLQTNWINLVTNVAVTNTSSYTNLIGTDPRRFYRVQRLP